MTNGMKLEACHTLFGLIEPFVVVVEPAGYHGRSHMTPTSDVGYLFRGARWQLRNRQL